MGVPGDRDRNRCPILSLPVSTVGNERTGCPILLSRFWREGGRKSGSRRALISDRRGDAFSGWAAPNAVVHPAGSRLQPDEGSAVRHGGDDLVYGQGNHTPFYSGAQQRRQLSVRITMLLTASCFFQQLHRIQRRPRIFLVLEERIRLHALADPLLTRSANFFTSSAE